MVAPKSCAACDARRHRKDDDVAWQRECNTPGVTAANENAIRRREIADNSKSLLDAAVPFFLTFGDERRMSDVFVEILPVAATVLAELELDEKTTVPEERETKSGAECEHSFKAGASSNTEALNDSVIQNAHVASEFGLERAAEVMTVPGIRREVGRGRDDAIRYDARKGNGDFLIRWQVLRDPVDLGDDGIRRRVLRRWIAHPRRQHFAIRIDHRSLDQCAADIY